MTDLLKLVWSFPSRLVRSLFVLIRLLFIVLISSKDMETMEFTVIMRIVKALSVTPPDGFCREVGNDRLELGDAVTHLVVRHVGEDGLGDREVESRLELLELEHGRLEDGGSLVDPALSQNPLAQANVWRERLHAEIVPILQIRNGA